MDVDGQRLLVDATYSPGTSAADRAELMAIVESLRFTDQAAPQPIPGSVGPAGSTVLPVV